MLLPTRETWILIALAAVLALIAPTRYRWFESKKDDAPAEKVAGTTLPEKNLRVMCLGITEKRTCKSFSQNYRRCEALCWGIPFDGRYHPVESIAHKLAATALLWIPVLWIILTTMKKTGSESR